MLGAIFLALSQLGDPRVLRVLLKSVLVTLVLFVVIGAAGWWLVNGGLGLAGMTRLDFPGAAGLQGVLSLVIVVIAGWLLWRIVALAVLQFYADEVVEAVEARHYPAAAASARRLGLHREIAIGLRGAGRALLVNLVALPFALALLITGVGTAAVFWAANAVIVGRELMELVWLRHRRDAPEPSPLGRAERWALGGIVSALLLVPIANLLAPVLGAAIATHLIHRKRAVAYVA